MKVLYILHAWNNLAGVENHTKTLIRELKGKIEAAVLYPEDDKIILRLQDKETKLPGRALHALVPFQDKTIDLSFQQALQSVQPDLIHFMHGFRWPLSIYEQVHRCSTPVIVSSHDFYPLTPDFTGQGGVSPEDFVSPEYSKKLFGQDVSLYLAQRRSLIRSSYERACLRTTPTQMLAEELQTVFPFDFHQMPYGITPFECKKRDGDLPLSIGFLGSLLPQKGWPYMWQAIQPFLEEEPSVHFHIFGGGDLPASPPPQVHFHGSYQPAELPSLLDKVDIVFLPSAFRETFCMALSEVWQAGRIPAVSRIGALEERVADGVNGKVFEPSSAEAILKTLRWFTKNDDWKDWTLPEPRLAQDMAEEYLQLYLRGCNDNPET